MPAAATETIAVTMDRRVAKLDIDLDTELGTRWLRSACLDILLGFEIKFIFSNIDCPSYCSYC